jgi:hypothetical protein
MFYEYDYEPSQSVISNLCIHSITVNWTNTTRAVPVTSWNQLEFSCKICDRMSALCKIITSLNQPNAWSEINSGLSHTPGGDGR